MTEKCGEVVIRDAVLTDAERIREIYDHYVRHTAISFEYETPTPEEMRERMHRTMARFPYLAAERDGVVQGYAYAGPFKERAWSSTVIWASGRWRSSAAAATSSGVGTT